MSAKEDTLEFFELDDFMKRFYKKVRDKRKNGSVENFKLFVIDEVWNMFSQTRLGELKRHQLLRSFMAHIRAFQSNVECEDNDKEDKMSLYIEWNKSNPYKAERIDGLTEL